MGWQLRMQRPKVGRIQSREALFTENKFIPLRGANTVEEGGETGINESGGASRGVDSFKRMHA